MSRRNEAEAPWSDDHAAERAARVRAMLDRWAHEDLGEEPDWDVSQVAGLSIREPDSRGDPGR